MPQVVCVGVGGGQRNGEVVLGSSLMTRNGEEWLNLKTTNQQQHLTSCKPLERKPAPPNHPCKIPSFPTPHAAPQPLLPFSWLICRGIAQGWWMPPTAPPTIC